MKLVFVFCVMLGLASALDKNAGDRPEMGADMKKRDCLGKPSWEALQCVSAKVETGVYTEAEGKELALQAMDRVKSSKMLRGVGYQWGKSGYQVGYFSSKTYILDQDATFVVNPLKRWYGDIRTLPALGSDKPTLLYLTGSINAPNMPVGKMLAGHQGDEHVMNVYKSRGWIADLALKVGCGSIEENEEIRDLETWKSTVLVVRGDQWCPEKLAGKFRLLRGSVERSEDELQNLSDMRFTWVVEWKNDAWARVSKYQEDF